ncbi:hypothetical protein Pmar_PMAR002517 [Perkinsus marinus ATCC 50983]|uniref:Uncharacterized protein n=1 Tax=Perkinsus marinus (strain ATCC 50983 / TXsc) TaxID=423536 RepID=C5LV05_PERM5|nr:hypothetical protein Pmar_PMAR002517 [Perkinsus marinus ATCC 50983]EEQ99420.1 hypothetical protein Pmar_PMAR002517 [Perkinsus marinus ATCC 50983]|eukprot:XP_002766703.1 hypothetical protein Pmar_PMAR002517 [Perkinsus marinus ATCC 50983]
MHRVKQLDEDAGWHYDQRTGKLTKSAESADSKQKYSWSVASLGGPDRVNALRLFFRTLSEQKHVALAVITRGNIGCVQLVLQNCGLLEYFKGGVFGNIGDVYGESVFDKSCRDDDSLSSLEGDEDHGSWSVTSDWLLTRITLHGS